MAHRLAIFAVACAVVFGIGLYAVLQPAKQQNLRQDHERIVLQNKVNEGRAAKRSLPLFREEIGRLEQEADRWLSQAPAGSGLAELLSHLGPIATKSGVTLESSVDDVETAARLTVRGSRQQVRAFFGALSGDDYPFVAGDFQLFAVEGVTGVLQADFVVSSVTEEPAEN